MTRLNWGSHGERYYELGLDRGVLYPANGPAVAWSGLTAVNETSMNSETTIRHIDGVAYITQKTNTEFSATISAFTYPPELDEYIPSRGLMVGRSMKSFGLAYRTMIGNDVPETEDAYLIHIVYNAIFTPQSSDYNSESESISITPFSWDVKTRPVAMPDVKNSSHFVVDSRVVYPWVLEELERVLYGSIDSEPRFPTPTELFDIFERGSILRIIDHGDGTWTATGPDDAVRLYEDGYFEISWPSVVYLNDTTYKISSL